MDLSAGQSWMLSSPSGATPIVSSSITSATAIPTSHLITRTRRTSGPTSSRRCGARSVEATVVVAFDYSCIVSLELLREADRAAASGRGSRNGDPCPPAGERRPLRRRPHAPVVHDAGVQIARRRTADVGRAALEARVRSLLPAGVLALVSRHRGRGQAGVSGNPPARRGPRTARHGRVRHGDYAWLGG